MSDLSSADVIASLDTVGNKIDYLRDATRLKFETARRARRRSNLAIGAVLGVFLLCLTSFWRQSSARDHDRTAAAVANCVNTNVAREKLIDYTNDRVDKRINSLLDVVFSDVVDATPEEAAQRAVAKDKIKADFAAEPAEVPPQLGPRDCSPKAVLTPTTLDPGR